MGKRRPQQETEALREHEERIQALQKMDPAEILNAKVKGLLQALRNGELTDEDVTQYTNISKEQLIQMIIALDKEE